MKTSNMSARKKRKSTDTSVDATVPMIKDIRATAQHTNKKYSVIYTVNLTCQCCDGHGDVSSVCVSGESSFFDDGQDVAVLMKNKTIAKMKQRKREKRADGIDTVI